MNLATALHKLRDGYRDEFPDRMIALYAERLVRYPEGLVLAAVDDLIDTATFRPSIGQIVERVAERALNLPTEEEAWAIAERGRLRDAPEPVRTAADYAGGRWLILHSENPTTVRAQFRQAYRNLREQALRDYAIGGRPAQPSLTNGQGTTMSLLPATTRYYPRPVMAREARRMTGRVMEPPTDEEKADAIEVLREGPDLLDEPERDALYAAAERIFAEAGESGRDVDPSPGSDDRPDKALS